MPSRRRRLIPESELEFQVLLHLRFLSHLSHPVHSSLRPPIKYIIPHPCPPPNVFGLETSQEFTPRTSDVSWFLQQTYDGTYPWHFWNKGLSGPRITLFWQPHHIFALLEFVFNWNPQDLPHCTHIYVHVQLREVESVGHSEWAGLPQFSYHLVALSSWAMAWPLCVSVPSSVMWHHDSAY